MSNKQPRQLLCETCNGKGKIRLLHGWAKCPDCETDGKYEEATSNFHEFMNNLFEKRANK